MRATWFLSTITAIVLGFSGTTAEATQKVRGTATVYAGGFPVVDVEWIADLDPTEGQYQVATGVTLKGWLEWFVDFEARHRAEGRLERGRVLPAQFQTRGLLNDETRRTDVGFTPQGPSEVKIEPVDPPDVRDPVPAEVLAGTVDPLSLFMLHATFGSAEEACRSPQPFFDGRRVVAVTLTPIGWDTLQAESDNRFAGKAFKCDVRHQVLAGQYKGDWPGKGDPVQASHIWIAKPEGSPFWQPVRLERSTGFGTVIAHMEEFEILGDPTAQSTD